VVRGAAVWCQQTLGHNSIVSVLTSKRISGDDDEDRRPGHHPLRPASARDITDSCALIRMVGVRPWRSTARSGASRRNSSAGLSPRPAAVKNPVNRALDTGARPEAFTATGIRLGRLDVPDFTVDRYVDRRARLPDRIESEGPFATDARVPHRRTHTRAAVSITAGDGRHTASCTRSRPMPRGRPCPSYPDVLPRSRRSLPPGSSCTLYNR
jgi:hypothetical protein